MTKRATLRRAAFVCLALALCAVLVLPAPRTGRSAHATPGARAAHPYPRYAAATTPLDHWRQRAQPVLVASQPWEQHAVGEPTVLYDAVQQRYQMWYTAGWDRSGTGYARSSDGLHWHKHSGPVLGLGAGGWAGNARQNDVLVYRGTTYLYFAPGDGTLRLATARDGVHFRTRRDPVLRAGRWDRLLANSAVWVTPDSRWHMLYDTWTADGTWQMGLALGTGPARWRKVAGPLSSLRIGYGTYGAPTVVRRGSLYHLYYLASRTSTLPTDIYHATSADLVHWHRVSSGPVLARALPWEVDQTADPCIVQAGSGRLLYFSGLDNAAGRAAIGLALG